MPLRSSVLIDVIDAKNGQKPPFLRFKNVYASFGGFYRHFVILDSPKPNPVLVPKVILV